MKKIYCLSLLVLLFNLPANSAKNNDSDVIKSVILKTFSAMKSVDSVALKSCFFPHAMLLVSVKAPEGNTIREVPLAKFVQSVMSRKSGELDERVVSWGSILIDHEIATAWVPYEFYLNGKFTHKGVDVFLLQKVGEDWKIQTLMYNMQKN